MFQAKLMSIERLKSVIEASAPAHGFEQATLVDAPDSELIDRALLSEGLNAAVILTGFLSRRSRGVMRFPFAATLQSPTRRPCSPSSFPNSPRRFESGRR